MDKLLANKPEWNKLITKANLKKLIHFTTSGTHFLFKGEFYVQVDGVAMGSPLAPILANLFLGNYVSYPAVFLSGFIIIRISS